MKAKYVLISLGLGLMLALLWLFVGSNSGFPVSVASAEETSLAPATSYSIIVKLRSELTALAIPTGQASLDAALIQLQVQSVAPLFDAARGDLALKQDLGLTRIYVLILPASTDLQDALTTLSADPAVEYAEPDFIGYGTGIPNDTRFGDQWNLHNTGQSGGTPDADIDAPEAWDMTTGATSTVLAIIDTGVDLDHPDLAGKIVAGYGFVYTDTTAQDDHGHGTHVAGIAAATTDNGIGVAGVCPECRIMPLKALSSTNEGFYSWWASAIEYAVDHGADVINMSMGGTSSSSLLHDAVRYAYNAEIPIAAAMMNDGDATVYYPAAYTETIAVGSTTRNDERSTFSNYGTHIDLVAPGTTIWSTAWDDAYATQSGTSMATPHVAGALGLIRSLRPQYTVEELRTLLRTNADDQVGPPGEDTAGWDPYFGSGRLNVAQALRSMLAVITVCHGGSCDHDNIQAAVDEAITSSIIKVASGTYTDTNHYGGLAQAVYINRNVTIWGGYTTAFVDPPSPDTNVTMVNAQGSGRVFYITGGITATIEGLRIAGGNATGLGGGQGGADAGGGVYVNTAKATFQNDWVLYGTASQGGGLYLQASNATFSGNLILFNTAGDNGGGLYLDSGDATFSGNSFTSNTASQGGGGLYLRAGSAAFFDATISRNNAADGGGLYLNAATATLSNTTVSDNTASDDGGGLYLNSGSTTLEGGSVSRNTTAGSGGGLYLDSATATLDDATISDNTASDDGGGLYADPSTAVLSGNTISGNDAEDGGGLFLDSSTTTLISNTISGNTASNDGGGLFLDSSTTTLISNTISGNTANNDGGGLYLKEGNAAASGNIVTLNTASHNGGGLCLWDTDVTLSGNSVLSNQADSEGGGLYQNLGDAALAGNTITSNSAANDGGGLYLQAGDTTLDGDTISLNTASHDGGGLHLQAGVATLKNNTFSVNSAVNDGGGLCLHAGDATLTGNSVISNAASHDGGGLHLSEGDALLNGNAVSDNHAANDGGGLFLDHNTSTLTNNDVSGNSADDDGGGLSLAYGDTTLNGNTVAINTAGNKGGGLYLWESNARFSGNAVISNTASHDGGGLYSWSADATFDEDDFLSNHADNRGGGLYLSFSDAILHDSTISGNDAANDGGGLCLGYSSVTLGDNAISGNSAGDDGGGLLLAYGDTTLNGNAVTCNTAGDGGGGLHLYQNDATLVNNLVADNQANGQGSGLYAEGSLARLLHTTIARNSGGDGTGFYASDTFDAASAITLTNTILVSHTVGLFVMTGNTARLEATLWGSGAWANDNPWSGTGTIYTGTLSVWDLPHFADPDAGDYHICSSSAAKDAGTNAGTTDDIDGDVRPHGSGYDIGADEHVQPKAIGDLSVINVITDTTALTVTLSWGPPFGAMTYSVVTYTLWYSDDQITDGNWAAATVITTGLAGSTSTYTATVPYSGDTVYFALAYWNLCGERSFVSSNATWPSRGVYLPLVMRNYSS